MGLSRWLDEHLETFVRPNLGMIPVRKDVTPGYQFQLSNWNKTKFNHLVTLWEAAKRKADGNTIVLPGRDVFLFEILARRDNYPSIFRPEISGVVARHIGKVPKYKDLFGVDSGYKGSVLQALGISDWALVNASWGNTEKAKTEFREKRQLVPDASSFLTEMCGYLEGAPKYWQTGRVIDSRVEQVIQTPLWFTPAAVLTQELWKHLESLPKPKSIFVSSGRLL